MKSISSQGYKWVKFLHIFGDRAMPGPFRPSAQGSLCRRRGLEASELFFSSLAWLRGLAGSFKVNLLQGIKASAVGSRAWALCPGVGGG